MVQTKSVWSFMFFVYMNDRNPTGDTKDEKASVHSYHWNTLFSNLPAHGSNQISLVMLVLCVYECQKFQWRYKRWKSLQSIHTIETHSFQTSLPMVQTKSVWSCWFFVYMNARNSNGDTKDGKASSPFIPLKHVVFKPPCPWFKRNQFGNFGSFIK